MNTPKSKRRPRYPESIDRRKPTNTAPNRYHGGLPNQEYATAIGNIVVKWTHLEDFMVEIMAVLLGDQGEEVAREVFSSVYGTQARIKVMRTLLERTPLNKDREEAFDEIIDEFESLTKERNNYVHGLWYTDEKQKVTRSDPTDGSYSSFLYAVPVSLDQARHVLQRIARLELKIQAALMKEWQRRGTLLPK